jgi:hypothetical protein
MWQRQLSTSYWAVEEIEYCRGNYQASGSQPFQDQLPIQRISLNAKAEAAFGTSEESSGTFPDTPL